MVIEVFQGRFVQEGPPEKLQEDPEGVVEDQHFIVFQETLVVSAEGAAKMNLIRIGKRGEFHEYYM